MQERRTQQRFMCAGLVSVAVKQPGALKEEPIIGNLEDISPSGACVQLDARVAEGADIEIICGGCRLRGQVRYCRYVGIGYDTGIAFDSPGAWSRQRYEPAHLLVIPGEAGR